MVKLSKKIVVFPQPFKSITLEVSDVESFKEADKILIQELNRYLDLLSDEDRKILGRTLGMIIVKENML